MSLDKNTSSEDNNEANKQPGLDQKKQEVEKKQDFQKLSNANNRKKTNIESRKALSKLGKEVLKGDIEYQKFQEHAPDYVEKMKESFTPNNNTNNFAEYIASANELPENQNSIGAIGSSLAYSLKSMILKPLGVIPDIFKIKDYKDLITGKAEHEGIKNA